MNTKKIERIVVFKKNINLSAAKKWLDKATVQHREGMDSSRGQVYFYKTGPKFIVTFPNKKACVAFIADNKKNNMIYEIYEPNWDIFKD